MEVQGSVGATGQTVSATVVVSPAQAVSVEAPARAEVWQGGQAELPAEVSVTWSNGDVTSESVTWDDVDTSVPGTYEVQGSVGATGQTVSAAVQVKAPEAGEVNGSAAVEVSVASGASAEEALSALPQTVPVTWSNGDVTDEPVAWDALTAEQEGVLSSREGGTVEVRGAVGTTGQTVSAAVEVAPAQVESVEAPQALSVESGDEPELPAEVPVTWSNGDVTDEPVAWDALTAEQEGVLSSREGGTVEVRGAVGTTGQTVSAAVEVAPAQVESVEAPQALSVESGDEPELPAEVPVTWSNGDVTDEPVAWDALTAEQEAIVSSREGGTVTVQGNVDSVDRSVSLTVDVQPAKAVQIEEIKPMSVEVGEVPKLPSQVSVTWSNGDVTIEPVTWDDIDTSKAGSYEVKGTLPEGDVTVSATVEVASDEGPATTPAASEPAAQPAASESAASSEDAAVTSPSTADSASPAEASEEASAREASGLPAWLIATIAGIGAALVAAGAFIVGKKYNAADEEPTGKHAK